MAEDSNLPEKDQSPIFKAGEAFSKKELTEKIMADPSDIDIDEMKEKVKSGEKVIKGAKDFFRKNYKEALNELDPDSSKSPSPWYYEFAYSPTTSFYRKIARTIESGEALDGAKDIIPMAKEAAGQKITNAKALKTGTVTEIVDLIGTKEIEGKEGFSSVRDEFNSKVKDEKNSFQTLYKAFRENLDLFNRDLSAVDDKTRSKIFSPENNAIISALAKALKEEGIENESVNAMAERFEGNIEKLLEKISGPGQKIEAAKEEAPKKEEPAKTPEVAKSEEKLEEKMEEKKAGGEQPPAPAPVETPKATETAPGAPAASEAGTPTPPEAKTEEAKLATPEVAPPAPKTEAPVTPPATPTTGAAKTGVSEEAKKSTEGAIEGIFSGITGKTEGGTEEGMASAASSSPALSKYSEMLESLFGPGVSSMIPELGGMGGEGGASQIAGEATKITEKILPKGETISPGGGIKETGVQKLASPLPTPAPKPTTPTSSETPGPLGAKSQEQSIEASQVEEDMATTEEGKSAGESQKPGEGAGGDFGEQLNLMVNLLSQLNETLQNPLIVTPTTKNF